MYWYVCNIKSRVLCGMYGMGDTDMKYWGVPDDYNTIRTLGELLNSNYVFSDVVSQLQNNLLMRLGDDTSRYPGIIGLDKDVIPALDRAILAGHDILLVGQIGQAKTRLAQVISTELLSPMPVLNNSITNDTPYDMPRDHLEILLNDGVLPASSEFYTSPETSEYIRDNKYDARIQWVSGERRSKFIVATPDVTVKDMVGYIDVAKVAKKGVDMYDIRTYSPGYLMQAKHGIFCIDELPVLDARKQVALLSVLQDGLFTAGSYPVIFRPRTVLFATANPIDYTHSGRIIEPLYDRLKSHIRTVYPPTIQNEMDIILQEIAIRNGITAIISNTILYILADIVRRLRNSPLVSQEKGVSVRVGIHGLELLIAEARRARPDCMACPRISDLDCLYQVARFELSEIDDTPENRLGTLNGIIDEAIKNYNVDVESSLIDKIKSEFEGKEFDVSNVTSYDVYKKRLDNFPALCGVVEQLTDNIVNDKDYSLFYNGAVYAKGSPDAIDDNMIKKEIMPVVLEMVLEWLCWHTPKILERRDTKYVLA